MHDGDNQPTDKDVFGSSSEHEDAKEDCSDKAASDSDSVVECYSEDDDDAESDTECDCAKAAREKKAEWDRYIAEVQQIYIDMLDGKPPTEDDCIQFAMNAMKDPWPWYRVLRDGILEHDLLQPIIDNVLNYLVLHLSLIHI